MFPLRDVAAYMKVATGGVVSSSGTVSSVSFIVFVMGHQVWLPVVHHLVKSRNYAVSLRENMAAILNPVPHALLQGTPTTPHLINAGLISRAHAVIHWQLYVTIHLDCHIFMSVLEMKHGMDSLCPSL